MNYFICSIFILLSILFLSTYSFAYQDNMRNFPPGTDCCTCGRQGERGPKGITGITGIGGVIGEPGVVGGISAISTNVYRGNFSFIKAEAFSPGVFFPVTGLVFPVKSYFESDAIITMTANLHLQNDGEYDCASSSFIPCFWPLGAQLDYDFGLTTAAGVPVPTAPFFGPSPIYSTISFENRAEDFDDTNWQVGSLQFVLRGLPGGALASPYTVLFLTPVISRVNGTIPDGIIEGRVTVMVQTYPVLPAGFA